jgi:hypothetical protein
MVNALLLLAQEAEPVTQPPLIFNMRNLILVVGIIVLVVGYKIYKNKTMG